MCVYIGMYIYECMHNHFYYHYYELIHYTPVKSKFEVLITITSSMAHHLNQTITRFSCLSVFIRQYIIVFSYLSFPFRLNNSLLICIYLFASVYSYVCMHLCLFAFLLVCVYVCMIER